jgi:hypothetical protein
MGYSKHAAQKISVKVPSQRDSGILKIYQAQNKYGS